MSYRDVLARDTASKRQKILKRIYHRNPEYFTNDLALMTALEAEGYFKVCRLSKTPSHELLEFDMGQVLKYLETHHEDLLNSFLTILPYIKAQSLRKQKQLLKVALTIFKLSFDRMTFRIGAAARPRVEFQKKAFGTAVKLECQNAALDELCLQGFGALDRGRSHEATAKLNEERKEAGQKGVKSKLTFFEFTWTDKVADECDFLTYLVDLKLIPAELLDYSHLPAAKQFAAVMDFLTPGMEAFEDYCGTASTASALHRMEVHEELLAAKREERVPELVKRDHKAKPPVERVPVVQVHEPEPEWLTSLLEDTVEAPESPVEDLTSLELHMRWVHEESSKKKALALASITNGLEF